MKVYDLHLPTLWAEQIFVYTFGNCNSEPTTVDAVLLKVIVNGKTVAIEELRAPYIWFDIFC